MKVTGKEWIMISTNERGAATTSDLEEQIHRRAYELYEQRGYEAGHETEDWLAAEAELTRAESQPLAAEAVKTNRKPAVISTGKAKAKQVK
jgi:hypothetical protein